ncbi:hypothetical protein [Streptomyces lanatus]|uniref:Secreted protein n=1 Tax=Streptomyces lanatus TaxID=66900 RepID=A0ABV1Y368_9ACTN|nr:hypothetical protein [Streptomyces lanatus]GHH26573.1 hypothetical protein GCM10018780_79990 [Streptomyces lanatus]
MVTAWSPWRIGGTRADAGSLPRVLALAVLLFGVLMTHGGHAESADGHLSISATASAAPVSSYTAAGADDHRGGHTPAHPGEQCLSGQPQQGSALAAPCSAARVRASTGADDALLPRTPAMSRPVDEASPAALRSASVVRQV